MRVCVLHQWNSTLDLEQRNSLCCSCQDESCAEKGTLFCSWQPVHPATLVLCLCFCRPYLLHLAVGWTYDRRSSLGPVHTQIQLPLVRCNLTLPHELQNHRMAPGQACSPAAYEVRTALLNRSFLLALFYLSNKGQDLPDLHLYSSFSSLLPVCNSLVGEKSILKWWIYVSS